MRRGILFFFLLIFGAETRAQIPDHIYYPNIQSVKLHRYNDPVGYPLLMLGSGEKLELHFDDMDGDIKNYYFSYQLCNADWTPASLLPFDYIRGFQSERITEYRNSSVALTRYTHYAASFPTRGSVPSRSGNYLLKVFLNNDTSQLAFTRRFVVVENKVSVALQLRQPFNAQSFLTDQRLFIAINTAASRINIMSPQDVKVAVLQNYNWPFAVYLNRPSIYRGNYFEYNDDETSFPAGREWRWADLRSLRLLSDRMSRIVDTSNMTEVYLRPDLDRQRQVYVYYRDINGRYTIENTDGYNPFWQSDYAWVKFSYQPPANQPYAGKDVYLYGELTNYLLDEDSKMEYNRETGMYEKKLFLKQGYYNYIYVTTDINAKQQNRFSLENTEGSFSNTENEYTVLVYYRAFGARADELIGIAQLNTMQR